MWWGGVVAGLNEPVLQRAALFAVLPYRNLMSLKDLAPAGLAFHLLARVQHKADGVVARHARPVS